MTNLYHTLIGHWHGYRIILASLGMLVLSGCATTGTDTNWQEMEYQRLDRLNFVAQNCETDLCRVMVAQESNRNQIRPAAPAHHPAWSIIDRTLAIGIPAYMGSRQTRDLVGGITGVAGIVAGMDRADNSITVGGNFGDTDNSQHIGGNFGDTRGDETIVGGNFGDTRGDEFNVGGNFGDTRGDEWNIGGDNRFGSDGPIDSSDNSNNSDNSDNSVNNPPPSP